MWKPRSLHTLGALVVLTLQLFSGLTNAFPMMRVLAPREAISVKREASVRHQHGFFNQRRATVLNVYMTSEHVNHDEESIRSGMPLRDRLRRATGFSLTAFRATGRAATGISFTAIYGTAVAVSGLWIRKITSVFLSVFPAWFRYFLQPILIAYYLPIFIIRGLTGPTRRQAKAKHEAVKESWKDAIQFAKQTENDGYWPVQVSGTFILARGWRDYEMTRLWLTTCSSNICASP
jgi:hypothetical protein